MRIKVLASTHPGYTLSLEDALIFSGHSAGICYMPDTIEEILSEPEEKTKKRIEGSLNNVHHSVSDHVAYNLSLENVPKIIAMILNNEKQYTTSEKSARYTKMKPTPKEQLLFDKWLEIFKKIIFSIDPSISEVNCEKKAQENARYLISVFTPTTMEYSTSLRQWNYLRNWFYDLAETSVDDPFFCKLKPHLLDFCEQTKFLFVEKMTDSKERKLSFFDNRESRKDEFGESYCFSYLASFAQLAQAQRHRTIDYQMKFCEKASYYVPPMIRKTEYEPMWLRDIESVAGEYPQGMLISVAERGTYENFILKTKERLCSEAQLEISMQTYDALLHYINATKSTNNAVHSVLKKYAHGGRCGAGYKCKRPCKWGTDQLNRLY